jgi:hypothetical protein
MSKIDYNVISNNLINTNMYYIESGTNTNLKRGIIKSIDSIAIFDNQNDFP